MRTWLFLLVTSLLLISCTSSYPYLVLTENCNCERYVHRDPEHKLEVEVSGTYRVSDRVFSSITISFSNQSRDTLSLQQAYLKGTSENVHYQFNGRFQPMPYVLVPPGTSYALLLEGVDTDDIQEPWHKIAGERVTLEMRGLLLGQEVLGPILITLVPTNPKLSS
jgi:uncharacterized protein YcfL